MGKPKIEGAGVNESTYFAMGRACSRKFSGVGFIDEMTCKECGQVV